MVFFDRTRRRQSAAPEAGATEPVAARAGERGAGYLAVRRTVEASQRELDRAREAGRPTGRDGATHVRLDRMYEVAMLVAAACEVAGVPPPEPVAGWPTELVRLRDLRERNALQARGALRPPD